MDDRTDGHSATVQQKQKQVSKANKDDVAGRGAHNKLDCNMKQEDRSYCRTEPLKKPRLE